MNCNTTHYRANSSSVPGDPTAEGGAARLVLELDDRWASTRHARLERRPDGWQLIDDGSKNGTFVGGQLTRSTRLVDGDLIEIGSTVLLFRDAVRRGYREPADAWIGGSDARGPLATLSLPWGRALAELDRLAASKLALVLHGESGTGKEVLARAVHERSARSGAYVALNCGALPDALVEGELFGHRRGAFSGAVDDRAGLVRAADRGTLFLDEIAELPLAAQVKLLRVLQEGEVTPLGASTPIPVDLRVVCASHRDLAVEVERGRFRADLLARLAGHTVVLPPLRERREDLGALVGALLRRRLGDAADAVRFEREAARQLLRYDWPLNVRELDHALGAAIALAAGGRIGLAHLPSAVAHAGARPPDDDPDAALRQTLVRRFAEHGGNVSAVAREMGKERVQIRRWCRRFAIDPDAFRRDPLGSPG